ETSAERREGQASVCAMGRACISAACLVSSDGKRLRCMFVAKVTAGNAYLTQQVSLGQSMCPPAGHDSVVGEVSIEHALSTDGPACL
ncbi:unnamed protein product, partial [Ectocarpus sp. 12 AP-2014]